MIDFTIETEIEGEGPLGLGTRLREVTEFEPERRFALGVIAGPLPLGARNLKRVLEA